MNRRNFLKAGLLTGASLSLPGVYGNYFAKSSSTLAENFDMVAVKNGEPEVMFDRGIEQLGGIKTFVKKNQKVLIKPNIGWDVIPERGGNTHPKLVKRIVEHCYQAGAKDVYVFDHTCDDWRRSYASSGIEKAVKEAGGKIVSGDSEGYYQNVTINGAKVLSKAKVHELVLDSDVFINVPILKSHSSTRLTVTMKNMMGAVWDRGYWHQNNLHQCIADYALFKKKPNLNVVDAYYVLKQNGPRGVSKNDVAVMKSMIITTDMVAADSAAAKLFGVEPDSISYIKIADSMGAGKKDLSALNIKRLIL